MIPQFHRIEAFSSHWRPRKMYPPFPGPHRLKNRPRKCWIPPWSFATHPTISGERGDLENAIDALDQSYAIILKINPNESPELLQQIDDLRFAISQRILQVYSSRATVLNGNHKAIPLDMNSHVKKAIEMFQGSHRKSFLAAYQRSGKYRPYIVKSLKKAGSSRRTVMAGRSSKADLR